MIGRDGRSEQQDQLKEFALYGSSRLGLAVADKIVETTYSSEDPDTIQTRSTRGEKQYEQANHLGNVLTVVGDQKWVLDPNVDDATDTGSAVCRGRSPQGRMASYDILEIACFIQFHTVESIYQQESTTLCLVF